VVHLLIAYVLLYKTAGSLAHVSINKMTNGYRFIKFTTDTSAVAKAKAGQARTTPDDLSGVLQSVLLGQTIEERVFWMLFKSREIHCD
jgi:hypothetical protein